MFINLTVAICISSNIIQSVQFSHSLMSNSVTTWTAAHQASLSITNSWSLLKLMPMESVMPSNHLIFCHPLLLLPSVFASIRVSSNESALRIRWPKDWSFSFNISPSNEHSGMISFIMDRLVLLAVQGTLRSLLQQHSSKASILWCSAFFIGEGNGNPLQYSCLGNPMDRGAWCSPWSREESDTTEQLHFHFSLSYTGEGNGNPV